MSTKDYLKETQAELHRISWPNRKTATILTVIVIIFSLLVAAYIGALDYVFTEILNIVI